MTELCTWSEPCSVAVTGNVARVGSWLALRLTGEATKPEQCVLFVASAVAVSSTICGAIVGGAWLRLDDSGRWCFLPIACAQAAVLAAYRWSEKGRGARLVGNAPGSSSTGSAAERQGANAVAAQRA